MIVMRGGGGDVDVLRCDDVMLCDGARYSRDMTEGASYAEVAIGTSCLRSSGRNG